MDRYKFRKLLKRYQDGTANETEKALVEAWYQSYPNPVGGSAGNDIKNSILLSLNQATQYPVISMRRLGLQHLKIAVTIVLVSAIGMIAYRQFSPAKPVQYLAFKTNAGELKRLVLQDSSVVWVNASTRIKYPDQFGSKSREVYLEEGEAFFEVKHKAAQPFIVHVNKLNVQVLGTSFNINAYHNLPALKVTVSTGKVGVSTRGKKTVLLTAGQELSYDHKTKAYDQHPANISTSQSWKNGYTYLQQATFNELSAVIKNQLGLTLKAGSLKVSGYRFTLRIQQNMPVDQTLQMISQMHNTHYRKEADEIIIY